MNVLLLQNSPGCGAQMKSELEAQGHRVIWIIGVAKLEEHSLVGLLPSPNPDNQLFGEKADADMARTVAVDLDEIDFAFCDARLIGPIVNGTDVVPGLVANGIVCCACSSAGNPPLVKAGAKLALTLAFSLRAFREGVLDLESAVKDPEHAAQLLEDFNTRTHQEMVQAKPKGERFETGFHCMDSLK